MKEGTIITQKVLEKISNTSLFDFPSYSCEKLIYLKYQEILKVLIERKKKIQFIAGNFIGNCLVIKNITDNEEYTLADFWEGILNWHSAYIIIRDLNHKRTDIVLSDDTKDDFYDIDLDISKTNFYGHFKSWDDIKETFLNIIPLTKNKFIEIPKENNK